MTADPYDYVRCPPRLKGEIMRTRRFYLRREDCRLRRGSVVTFVNNFNRDAERVRIVDRANEDGLVALSFEVI